MIKTCAKNEAQVDGHGSGCTRIATLLELKQTACQKTFLLRQSAGARRGDDCGATPVCIVLAAAAMVAGIIHSCQCDGGDASARYPAVSAVDHERTAGHGDLA